jgi:hypothetical protein
MTQTISGKKVMAERTRKLRMGKMPQKDDGTHAPQAHETALCRGWSTLA